MDPIIIRVSQAMSADPSEIRLILVLPQPGHSGRARTGGEVDIERLEEGEDGGTLFWGH
jgi:hypothetical protein